VTPAAAKPSAGQPGCEPRKAETMQSESRTTRMREPLDQVIYRFARRADKEQLSRRSERPDEFSWGCDPFGCRRKLHFTARHRLIPADSLVRRIDSGRVEIED